MSNNDIQGDVAIFAMIKNCKRHKKLFFVVGIVTFVIACLLIIPVPRYYTCSTKLMPELGGEDGNSSIGALAAQFGLNFADGASGDAISPTIYPDVLQTYDFAKRLINVPVKTIDGSISCDYYTYLKKHQKPNPLTAPLRAVKRFVRSFFSDGKKGSDGNEKDFDTFMLSEEQANILNAITGKISCYNDIKTSMITISVRDQDPLVAGTIVNAVSEELQQFITDYRTNKANVDYQHFKKLTEDAKQAYQESQRAYAAFSEANQGLILERYKMRRESLESDMQLKFSAYSSMLSMFQSAQARLQQRTPVFTVVESATVPQKPSGPKRMLFVALMLILSMVGTTIYSNKDLIKKLLQPNY